MMFLAAAKTSISLSLSLGREALRMVRFGVESVDFDIKRMFIGAKI